MPSDRSRVVVVTAHANDGGRFEIGLPVRKADAARGRSLRTRPCTAGIQRKRSTLSAQFQSRRRLAVLIVEVDQGAPLAGLPVAMKGKVLACTRSRRKPWRDRHRRCRERPHGSMSPCSLTPVVSRGIS